jgi:hypothetical protein
MDRQPAGDGGGLRSLGPGTRESRDVMILERLRIGVSALWMFVALYIAIDLRVSWTTGPLLLALGIIPPITLLFLWNHPLPAMGRRPKDPRL